MGRTEAVVTVVVVVFIEVVIVFIEIVLDVGVANKVAIMKFFTASS